MGRVLLLLATLTVCCLTPATAVCSGCCEHMGNVDGSSDGLVTMGDLTIFLDHLFISYLPLDCMEAGNMDLSPDGLITMGDLTVMLDHLFISYSPLPPCPDGDCPPTVTDIDGNVYQTVLIDDLCWMMENLKVTHYRNGDSIPSVADSNAWSGLITGAYCEYDSDAGHVAVYGRLYNWHAVNDSRNIAPAGWHVASREDWQALANDLGGDAIAGGKLKEAGYEHWTSPNTGATNESGFSALPGGYRLTDGSYDNEGKDTYLWSATEYNSSNAWYRSLNYNYAQLFGHTTNKRYGFSVRCVRD